MILARMFVSIVAKTSRFAATRRSPLFGSKQNFLVGMVACRFVSTHHVTKNLELISQDNKTLVENGVRTATNSSSNPPLLVMLCWLMSKRKHIMKFVNLYAEQGFDVMTVSVTPWQLMWPVKGTRVIAKDLLNFLDQNKSYEQIMLHGFSVGGYMWGEVLDLMQNDNQRYDNIIDRIVGQVWDSAADITEVCIGTPRAVFPKNAVMQKVLEKYMEPRYAEEKENCLCLENRQTQGKTICFLLGDLRSQNGIHYSFRYQLSTGYHMKTFHSQATQYYIRSSQQFHMNRVRTPALFMLSNTDPVGAVASNMRVRDSWDSLGTPTYVKIFEKSPHVGHYQKYPKEYVHELYTFLERLNMIRNEKQIRARL